MIGNLCSFVYFLRLVFFMYVSGWIMMFLLLFDCSFGGIFFSLLL